MYVLYLYRDTSFALLHFLRLLCQLFNGQTTYVHYLHKHFLNICLGMGGGLDWFKSVFGERLQIHRIKLGFFSSGSLTGH